MRFPLVIIAIIGKFDVSQIFTDGSSSYNIIYTKLFNKVNLDQSRLLAYEGSDLQVFNGNTTHP